MIIHTALKALTVAGFVLVLLNSSSCHPISYQGEPRGAGSYGRMTMLRKSCVDSLGNSGICMFKWDCISQKGTTLATCVDGFLFGACCALKDVKDKRTDDKYFKTDTNSNKSNTIFLLKFVTSSSLPQKTESSESQDFLINSSLNLPSHAKGAALLTQDDLNIDSTYITTDSSSSFVNNDGIHNADTSVEMLDSLSNKSNIFKYSFINASNTDRVHIKKDAHESTMELKLKGDDEDDYAYDYRGHQENIDRRNNATDESKNDTPQRIMQSFPKENTTNGNEPSQQSNLSSTYAGCHTYKSNSEALQTEESDGKSALLTNSVPLGSTEEIHNNISIHYNISLYTSLHDPEPEQIVNKNEIHNNIHDNILLSTSLHDPESKEIINKKEIHNNISIHDNISLSSLLQDPESEQIVSKNPYEFENKNLEVKDSIVTKTLINNRENLITELRKYNISTINSTKEIDSISTKEITPPVWSNYTSLLPSSFQSLIAQLTSRDRMSEEINMQSNLTTNNLDIKNIKSSATQKAKQKQNNSLTISFHQELKNTENLNQDVNDINNTISIMELNSRESFQFMSTFNETSTANNSVSSLQMEPNALKFHKHILNNTQLNREHLQESVSETNDILASVFLTETDLRYTTKSFDDSKTESTVALQVFCNEENDLKVENCTKYISNSDKGQDENIFVSSEDSLKETNKTLSFYPKLITDSSFSQSTKHDDIHKNAENQILSTSLNFATKKKESNEPYELFNENSINKLNDQNDKRNENYTDSKNYSGIDLSLDEINSISTYTSSDNIILDQTTDKNNYFAELVSSHFPLLHLIPKPDTYGDNNLDSQSSNENIGAASQEEDLFTSSSQNTISEIITSSSITDFASMSEENHSESALNSSAQGNHFMTDYTTETNFDKEFVYSTNHKNELTTINNEIIKNDYNKNIQAFLNESLNKYKTTKTSFTVENFETYATYSLDETELSTSFQQNQSEPTQTQNMSPAAFNLRQNLTAFSSVTTSVPPENTFIPTTDISPTEPVTSSNHKNTASANVSVEFLLGYTVSNSSLLNRILTTNQNTLSSESYSTSPMNTHLNEMLNKNHSGSLRLPSNMPEKTVMNHVWNYKKDCGIRPMQANGRIVGGRNTYFGQWPWQALVKEATWLGLFVKNKCGGVLITSKYVLTAAHCQPGFLASLLVVLGTHDLSNIKESKNPIIHNVKRMIVHRHYNPQTFENDLALLEMDTELEFLPHVVPICLPHRNEDFTGEMAFVTGWGKLTHGGDVPNILQEVQVPIVENRECQMMFYQAGHQKAIQSNFVCAGYINGGQDSCEGDSGGPLMVQRKDKRWVLVGTVSHGIGCADPNLPGVYMRMSSYRPWIDSIIYK